MTSFQCRGLDPREFQRLFPLSDEDLALRGARRIFADEPDAYPCRVSLRRAKVGEELLLVHYEHQPNPASPYRAGGPIFVSRRGKPPPPYRDELPPALRDRVLSLRAYDSSAFIVDAEVAESEAAPRAIRRFLADPAVSHVDAHFAGRGCFAARFERCEADAAAGLRPGAAGSAGP